MSKRKDMTGQRYGRLVVLNYEYTKDGKAFWRCRCDCGKEVIVCALNIRSGNTKSCGCLEKENRERLMDVFYKEHYRHGKKNSVLYRRWCHMKERCNNKNDRWYSSYGGRGIKVCEEWEGENGFAAFEKWALGNGYNEKLTLDRVDVNGNYEPSNCRWVDNVEQANNRRSSRYMELDGEIKTLAEWCREYGAKYSLVRDRIERGWDLKRALTEKPRAIKRK